MTPYTLAEIAEITQGKLDQVKDASVNHLVIDSRKVFSPEDTVFFALKGERHDGHQFIGELWEKGVRNFVVSKMPGNREELADANFILVSDTLYALQLFASYHRSRFDSPVIGITGSNGKTIVKEWIFHILDDRLNLVRSPKSYNSQVGVPLSVLNMAGEDDIAVFEAGISRPGEMERLARVINPGIGLITNIGEAHQENFSDLQEKLLEKLKLFEQTDTIVYCKDHYLIDRQIIRHNELRNKNLVTWSKEGDADLKIQGVEKVGSITRVHGRFQGRESNITIPFTDEGSLENAIHVWLLMLHLGVDSRHIQEKMKDLPGIAMRLEMKKGINSCTLINDSYNSDLGSLHIALNMLNHQNQHQKRTLILSDILQSGRESRDLYAQVADLIRRNRVDRLIGIGEAISANRHLFDVPRFFYRSTRQFLSALPGHRFRDEAILLKGSRDFHFEKLSHALEEQMHQTVLEIDMDALVHNLNHFRSLLQTHTRLMIMVKAFSYGSGSYEIANLLQYQRADYLGVAFADEGVTLREAGITLPVVVMNPEEDSFPMMVDYELEPEIYNTQVLEQFEHAAAAAGKEEYPVHLKLDTGMNRLGFKPMEVEGLITRLDTSKHLKVRSVFSHLAASDESEQDDFTREQIDLFDRLSNKIIRSLGYPVIRHILNSAGIERFPDAQFDMVRLGIGLYGVSSIDQDKLRNISTFKSTVTQVKTVEKGATIGYGRAARAEQDLKIAVIPVGYADGFNRALSNGVGRLYINGFYVPVIGNICMDMCMADITGCDIKEGDEVIIFGDELPVSELADKLHTIPYEIFTGIPERVKRVYYQE
jgi:alanine racemase